jgi:hypothetical protein
MDESKKKNQKKRIKNSMKYDFCYRCILLLVSIKGP